MVTSKSLSMAFQVKKLRSKKDSPQWILNTFLYCDINLVVAISQVNLSEEHHLKTFQWI
jgi:hypothetical protein